LAKRGSQGKGDQSDGISRSVRFKESEMIRKLKSGEFRIYSKHLDEKGKRKNLGTFASREKAEAHEKAIQYFKRH
jgi:hypothetical protein